MFDTQINDGDHSERRYFSDDFKKKFGHTIYLYKNIPSQIVIDKEEKTYLMIYDIITKGSVK